MSRFLGKTGGLAPVGSVTMQAGDVVPAGWLACSGASVLRADYPALSDYWASCTPPYPYGSADGTHMTLPNIPQGIFPTGGTPAATGGAATHTLTSAEMPAHTHTQNTHNHTQDTHNHTQDTHNHTQNSHNHTQNGHNHDSFDVTWFGYADAFAVGTLSGIQGVQVGGAQTPSTSTDTPTNVAATATNVTTVATNQTKVATNQATVATNQNTGGGGAHNNVPPFLGFQFIIKT